MHQPQWRTNAEAEIKVKGLSLDKEMEEHLVNHLIVVIWIGHTGSYEDHAPLLGK
jgi:hypothetical protein